jgi:ABC-type spermidine/putrescine transport system permease subunit II
MEDFGIFYGHLVYFTAIWYVLWPFRIVYGHLVYFSPFWYVCCTKGKPGNPAIELYAHNVF